MPPPTIEPDENLLVVSFDGSARVKRSGGAYSAVVWKLPEWTVVEAMSEYMPDLTVNEAEYRGLILGFDLISTLDKGRVVLCGDSNLVIRQMQSEMECKAPGLQLLRQNALNRLRSWPKHEFLHVKREWNQSADKLARATLQREEGEIVTSEDDRQNLITLNRLGGMLKPIGIADLKKYLDGEVGALTAEKAKACSKIVVNYEVDENRILFFCPKTLQQGEDRDGVVRMVIPDCLQRDFLHHYHASLEGCHQGVGRTYRRIQANFHSRGLYRSVQHYVGKCTDWKGKPTGQGESPGSIQGTYPFQVISMDHIPSLPKSFKGNTELLIWADLFTGYVIANAGPSREAQAVAENYEECVFRRFGASEVIGHDRNRALCRTSSVPSTGS
ncbi:reverse transcriptase [Phytophthora megakarya]|uniref:Reverse transcriptase n=1 Tax=Phytophthora megakarya TaxID=4795 RepID=A0A225V2M6_9STRA|nr:reverse transcriptase [Phytophthora megakarya]